jgi:hypothetical protein
MRAFPLIEHQQCIFSQENKVDFSGAFRRRIFFFREEIALVANGLR